MFLCIFLFLAEDHDQVWRVETGLAETCLFKSLNKYQVFKFYFFFILINNLKQLLASHSFKSSTSEAESVRVNKRVLLHHYLRYLELTNSLQESVLSGKSSSKKSGLINKEVLLKFCAEFSEFLRTGVLGKHKTLNRPNFFNLNAEISYPASAAAVASVNWTHFENLLKNFESYLKSTAKSFEYSVSFKCLSLEIAEQHQLFNEYMHEFFKILIKQFKLKRDNFKINEDILLDIHTQVVRAESAVSELFSEYSSLNQVDLLTEFELYAECVHKYLPKVRQYNQFLLFHYLWTMQVQYLAPFFNYMSDLYNVYV